MKYHYGSLIQNVSGTGFIGRHLVTYLVESNLASSIRVADKALLQTAYLTPQQAAAFEKVEFVQANLTRDASIAKAFARDAGSGGSPFDIVINCAGMTQYGQEAAVYKEGVFDLSIACAKAAAAAGCRRFVELSTAQVYAADKVRV